MKLDTKPRELSRKNLKDLRKGGGMPIVCYGPKKESEPLQVSVGDFTRVWKEGGETSVISIQTKDGDVDALIHEVEFHPTSGEPVHADLYIMEKGKPVEVAVPLEFEGVAPAVKDHDGILVKVLHEVEIEALAKDLPNEIVVDITSLETLEDVILVKDLKVPAGVTVLTEAEEMVALVSVQKEEEEESSEEIDLETAVEVEQKGKKDEDTTEGETKE